VPNHWSAEFSSIQIRPPATHLRRWAVLMKQFCFNVVAVNKIDMTRTLFFGLLKPTTETVICRFCSYKFDKLRILAVLTMFQSCIDNRAINRYNAKFRKNWHRTQLSVYGFTEDGCSRKSTYVRPCSIYLNAGLSKTRIKPPWVPSHRVWQDVIHRRLPPKFR